MRITEKLLKQLDFKQLEGFSETWTFGDHHVTDIEEMIVFAYRDGLEDGKDALRQEIHELLRIDK